MPAAAGALDPGARFYTFDLAKPDEAPVAVTIKEGSLPGDLSAFAASPDGRFVAVVESGTDVVAVLELATGRVKIVSPLHSGWKSRLIPAWRNSRELTFAGLPSATGTRPELILWQADAPQRVLSKDWPERVVAPWLEGAHTDGKQQPR